MLCATRVINVDFWISDGIRKKVDEMMMMFENSRLDIIMLNEMRFI